MLAIDVLPKFVGAKRYKNMRSSCVSHCAARLGMVRIGEALNKEATMTTKRGTGRKWRKKILLMRNDEKKIQADYQFTSRFPVVSVGISLSFDARILHTIAKAALMRP